MVLAARMGDVAWRHALAAHELLVNEEIRRYRGQRVSRTPAGIVVMFDGPARAIRCASAIVEGGRAIGLDLRAGLHCGECERVGGDIRGVAPRIAARVMGRADAGEILVSSTITDLVAGAGIHFAPLDRRLVTGSDRDIELFRVTSSTSFSFVPSGHSSDALTNAVRLSPREIEVATLIGRGYSNRQIADDLSISVATVERHTANIFNKLGAHSRSQVAVWAAGEGLLRSGGN
jgi:DNA-binding CsgD family transcriptional regulator